MAPMATISLILLVSSIVITSAAVTSIPRTIFELDTIDHIPTSTILVSCEDISFKSESDTVDTISLIASRHLRRTYESVRVVEWGIDRIQALKPLKLEVLWLAHKRFYEVLCIFAAPQDDIPKDLDGDYYHNLKDEDEKDHLMSERILVVVSDDEAPTIESVLSQPSILPAQVGCLRDIEAFSALRLFKATLKDNCAGNIVPHLTTTMHYHGCPNKGTFVAKVVATDLFGHSATHVAQVAVADELPPIPTESFPRSVCIYDIQRVPLNPVAVVIHIARSHSTHQCDEALQIQVDVTHLEAHLCPHVLKSLDNGVDVEPCRPVRESIGSANVLRFARETPGGTIHQPGTVFRSTLRLSSQCGNTYPTDLPLEIFMMPTLESCRKMSMTHIAATQFKDIYAP